MNVYTELLKASLIEIDEFSKSSNGTQWDSHSYKRLQDLVEQAAAERDPARVEDLLDMIMWSIVDPVFVGPNFAPSLDRAHAKLVEIRRRREIDRNKST